jgi:hypothetical protein
MSTSSVGRTTLCSLCRWDVEAMVEVDGRCEESAWGGTRASIKIRRGHCCVFHHSAVPSLAPLQTYRFTSTSISHERYTVELQMGANYCQVHREPSSVYRPNSLPGLYSPFNSCNLKIENRTRLRITGREITTFRFYWLVDSEVA